MRARRKSAAGSTDAASTTPRAAPSNTPCATLAGTPASVLDAAWASPFGGAPTPRETRSSRLSVLAPPPPALGEGPLARGAPALVAGGRAAAMAPPPAPSRPFNRASSLAENKVWACVVWAG
jgi:hypothetical protein